MIYLCVSVNAYLSVWSIHLWLINLWSLHFLCANLCVLPPKCYSAILFYIQHSPYAFRGTWHNISHHIFMALAQHSHSEICGSLHNIQHNVFGHITKHLTTIFPCTFPNIQHNFSGHFTQHSTMIFRGTLHSFHPTHFVTPCIDFAPIFWRFYLCDFIYSYDSFIIYLALWFHLFKWQQH
jgi:hypothetical protein